MQPIALSIYTQHKGKSHSNDNHVLAKLLWRPCKRRGDARRYFLAEMALQFVTGHPAGF